MHVTLDAQTEQRIQREIDRGHYREPTDVIARALDLLQAEEDWLLEHRDRIGTRLGQSLARLSREPPSPPTKATTEASPNAAPLAAGDLVPPHPARARRS